MNLYPALKGKMGSWNYYTVKMSARELSESVRFAYEVYDDRTLDQAIQRILNESRVKKEIVQYLKRQPDRFFSSIVIAAIEGDPKYYPIEIMEDPRFQMLSDDKRFSGAFGVLKFDGTQQYYALDGQHRLSAIKTIIDKNNPLSDGAPQNFENEEFSVIVVVPNQGESRDLFLQKYRRLFANLNRYAKPTDQATNIIMDEDDTFAILTRRLISEQDFFKSAGRHRESIRIKTEKGKNLRTRDPYFTSLETLYDINIELLRSRARENNGWGPAGEGEELSTFKRFRPQEEYLDALFEELTLYWNAIIDGIPDLRKDPSKMRNHNLTEEEEGEETDHLLFWPIGQEMLAEIVRQLLDTLLPNPEEPKEVDVKRALIGLEKLQWDLHQPPWKYFLLIQDDQGRYKIRSEQRKEVIRIARRIQQWSIGLDELDAEEIDKLQKEWSFYFIPSASDDEIINMWREVEENRSRIVG
jgi:DNA sulfur modification protein DndB